MSCFVTKHEYLALNCISLAISRKTWHLPLVYQARWEQQELSFGGSATYFHTHDECQLLQKYINTVLGPYVKNLTQFLSRCCVFYCSAHGRCVDKELEAVAQHERRESGQQHCLIREELLQRENRDGDGELDFGGSLDPPHPYDNYVCRCLPGWTGDHCEKKLWAWGESCMCLCYFSFADHNYEEILGALEPKPKSTLTPHEWFL